MFGFVSQKKYNALIRENEQLKIDNDCLKDKNVLLIEKLDKCTYEKSICVQTLRKIERLIREVKQ